MKVKDVMTPDVKSCPESANVGEIARIMWDCDCGIVPVVDDQGKVTGVVTDRDIFLALATKNLRASDLAAKQVRSNEVHCCRPNDEVEEALDTMRDRKVQRLPVVDPDGKLQGMLSMHDIVLAAGESRGAKGPGRLTHGRVMETLQAICQSRTSTRTRRASAHAASA